LGLSEEAKLEYLRERIKQAKSREREGIMFLIIGIVLTSIIFAFFGDILFQILSVFVIIIGVVQMFYFGYRKEKLMEQLREMAYKEKEGN